MLPSLFKMLILTFAGLAASPLLIKIDSRVSSLNFHQNYQHTTERSELGELHRNKPCFGRVSSTSFAFLLMETITA